MQHDPNRPEDVLKVDADEDGIGGDDAADALRYLVATKSRGNFQKKIGGGPAVCGGDEVAGNFPKEIAGALGICDWQTGKAYSDIRRRGNHREIKKVVSH